MFVFLSTNQVSQETDTGHCHRPRVGRYRLSSALQLSVSKISTISVKTTWSALESFSRQRHINQYILLGRPYHSPKLHPGSCSSAGIRRGTDRHTDTQTCVTNIHFASSTTHVKYNDCIGLHNVPRLSDIQFMKQTMYAINLLTKLPGNKHYAQSQCDHGRTATVILLKPVSVFLLRYLYDRNNIHTWWLVTAILIYMN